MPLRLHSSAIRCRLTDLPVPVAPAISPWRLAIAGSSRASSPPRTGSGLAISSGATSIDVIPSAPVLIRCPTVLAPLPPPGRDQNGPMPWFLKTETFTRPAAELRPALAEHRAWVEQLRCRGVRISSGYLVDAAGRPGGGGLLLLEAADQASAEALIRDDPMLRSGGVSWQLQRWVSAVGDLGVDG